MAAALLKKTVHTRSTRRSLFRSWNGSIGCPKPEQYSALNRSRNLLQESKRFTRLVHSGFRDSTVSSVGNSVNSNFSTRAASSSLKFGLLDWYLTCLNTRPIVTKSITASVIYAAADATSQKIFAETSEEYDAARTLRMGGYGMLILGPSIHHWYNYMSRIFPRCDLLSTFQKVALGQTVYGPAMTAIFFSFNAALRGESGPEIVARLKRDLLPTMINGAMYWPVCDFLTFKFIPVNLQPLVTNSFSYLWTIYMTYMASLEKATESSEGGEPYG